MRIPGAQSLPGSGGEILRIQGLGTYIVDPGYARNINHDHFYVLIFQGL